MVQSGEMAGGQRVCFELIKEELHRGSEISIVSTSQGSFTRDLPEEVKATILSYDSMKDITHLPSLIRYLQREKPNLIHTHTTSCGNILWRIAALITRTKIINHIHTSENFFGSIVVKKDILRFVDTLTSRSAAAHIAVSKYTMNKLISQGYQKEKLHLIYNGPPWCAMDAMLAENVYKKSVNIGCVGRLCKQKGQEDLLRAFEKILHVKPATELWIVGSDHERNGCYEEKLRRLANSLGISAATKFFGQRDDVRNIMSQMDVLVLPSYDEGFPLVILEAMASGLPVIATERGGIPEIVTNGETGLLIPAGNIDAMIQTIIRLIEDIALRSHLAKNARRKVAKEFNKESMLFQVHHLYESLISEQHALCN